MAPVPAGPARRRPNSRAPLTANNLTGNGAHHDQEVPPRPGLMSGHRSGYDLPPLRFPTVTTLDATSHLLPDAYPPHLPWCEFRLRIPDTPSCCCSSRCHRQQCVRQTARQSSGTAWSIRIPVVGGIYKASKQLTDRCCRETGRPSNKAVADRVSAPWRIPSPPSPTRCRARLHDKLRARHAAVYIPTAPNPTGGYMLLLPESRGTDMETSTRRSDTSV